VNAIEAISTARFVS